MHDEPAAPAPIVLGIAPDDLGVAPSAHRDAALRRARRELDSAQRSAIAADDAHRRAIEAHDTATAAASDAVAAHADLDSLAEAARDDLDAAERDAEQAAEQLEQRRAELEQAEATLARFERVAQELAELVAAGAPGIETDHARFARSLDERIDELVQLDGVPDLTALVEWHEQLADGTAPVREDATALLSELSELDGRWRSCGAGDLDADPVVRAAEQEVQRRQDALDAIGSGAAATAAGHQARLAIEMSHRTRTELEAQGRRADHEELAAAVRVEQEALGHVGFDSWLDYRVAMSGAGAGALAERRRGIATTELEDARTALEQARTERAAHHDELRTECDRLVQLAVQRCGVQPLQDVEHQLRRVMALPDGVRELADRASDTADAARAACDDARVRLEAVERELADATTRRQRGAEQVDRLAQRVRRAARAVETTTADLDDTAEQLELAERAAEAATQVGRVAEDEVSQLEATPHLSADLDDLVASVVDLVRRSVDEQPDAEGDDHEPVEVVVQLVDPLAELPVDVTVQLVDELEATGLAAELVTSRRALAGALRHHTGPVRVVHQRRWSGLGQRRRREPATSTR